MPQNEVIFHSLESIIKVEPEAFQENYILDFREAADEVLRFKANIFSEPTVLLERIADEIKNSKTSGECQKNSQVQEVDILVKKGNDRLGYKDLHTCCLCQKTFSNRSVLKMHLESFHLKTRKMFCDLCSKVFYSRRDLTSHLKNVHGNQRFSCNICYFKTASKNNFKRHRMTHGASVKCPICFNKVSVLKNHMRAHNSRECCRVCQKMYSAGNMRKHMKTHERLHRCKSCDETFEVKEDFRRHTLTKHYDKEVFECHCGLVFKRRSNLKSHQITHNSERLQEKCEVCKKQFAAKSCLKVHWNNQHKQTHGLFGNPQTERVLSRKGPFICDHCGSKLSSRNSFKQHYLSHQSVSMFCDLCSRSFNHKLCFMRHFRKFHLNVRLFQCKVCDHKSFVKGDLKRHMLQHKSKTECEICHKFVVNMYDHLRTHVKVKCPICSKIYSKMTIREHMKKHAHKIKTET